MTIAPVVAGSTTALKGVGVVKPADPTKPGASMVPELIDPMTTEVISAVTKRDATGFETINDSAFTIRAKFIWKNAPAVAGQPAAGQSSEAR
jgi:hypothetical protein